jgi:hypothetical protein
MMPYLGQQENELPVVPVDRPLRAEVADYPTDFDAMSEETIELLRICAVRSYTTPAPFLLPRAKGPPQLEAALEV